MNAADPAPPLAPALGWIVRLPLLGDGELAMLLGLAEPVARGMVDELGRRAWVDWIVPASPELDPCRLAFLRGDQALPALAEASGVALREIGGHLPAPRAAILDRVGRLEITAGVSRLLSDLAAIVRTRGVGELADARSLPMDLAAHDRWWPAGVDGYGCLRSGNAWAPFFVAWDRARAPDLHRRKRVALWTSTAGSVRRAWEPERVPAVLVVAAGERALGVWEEALWRRRDAPTRPDVLLTTAGQLLSQGADAAVWREPGRDLALCLTELVGWGSVPRLPQPRIRGPVAQRDPRRAPFTLDRWAARARERRRHWSERGRVAIAVLSTSAGEKRVLEWVARHPLLSASELATLLARPEAAIELQLAALRRLGLLIACPDSREATPAVTRYALTDLGLRLLAARDGVPRTRYGQFAGVTIGSEEGPRAAVTVRARLVPHTLGVNRAFVLLAEDARRAGGRLAQWRNEAESTRHFTDNGRGWFIRPDGSGVLELCGDALPFLLEYDRGTEGRRAYRAKFAGFWHYFDREEWTRDFDRPPPVLFVCVDDRAEGRVVQAATENPIATRVLITSESRYGGAGAPPGGILGPVWRRPDDPARRCL